MNIVLHWPQWVVLAWVFVMLLNAVLPPFAWEELAVKSIVWGGVTIVLLLGGFFSQACAQTIPSNAARYRADLVRAAHANWGLDAPIAALAAQVHQESGWNPQAVSQVGATGMAQFMPATAAWWCELIGTPAGQCQPKNPTWALAALVGYDKWLFDRTPARYSDYDRMHVALRAYNGGLGHWQAEAKATGLSQPTVDQVAAACGKARRHASHCRENLGYPLRIVNVLQPRYLAWGPGV